MDKKQGKRAMKTVRGILKNIQRNALIDNIQYDEQSDVAEVPTRQSSKLELTGWVTLNLKIRFKMER